MSTCQACVELLREYLDGELDFGTHEELSGHLKKCSTCDEFLKSYSAMPKLCREALAEQMPQDLAHNLRAFLRARAQKF
jgi:anti-sigma factor RsiW